MDTEISVQEQLLAEAKKQTKALGTLQNIAWLYVALTVLGALAWIIALNADSLS